MTDSRDGKKEAQPAVITSSVRVIEGASIQVAKKPEKVVPCTVKEEQSSDKKTMMGFPTPSIIHDDPPPGVSAPSSEDPRKTVRGVPTVKVADEGEEFSEKPIDSRKTQEGFAVVGGGDVSTVVVIDDSETRSAMKSSNSADSNSRQRVIGIEPPVIVEEKEKKPPPWEEKEKPKEPEEKMTVPGVAQSRNRAIVVILAFVAIIIALVILSAISLR